MVLDTFTDESNKTIVPKVSCHENQFEHYLEELKKYIIENFAYAESDSYDSFYTESSYIFIGNIKIRISDHLPNSCSSTLNIIKTKDRSDNFIIMMNKNKQPYLMNFEELKLFVKHYLMIEDSKITAEKAKDTSTLIKEANIQNNLKQEEQKQQTTYIKEPLKSNKPVKITLREELESKNFETVLLSGFNTPNYINSKWKAFESQYLIKDLNWYGDIAINDVKRNYICMIICKCASGGLSYKDTIDFIGNAKSIDELSIVLNKAKDLYDTDIQRANRILAKYNDIDFRLANWNDFLKDFYSVFYWLKDLAQTNKDIIFGLYKKDLPIKFLSSNMCKIYKQYGNMKYNACLAYRDLIKEKVEAYNQANK